jgi:hypothetical protein
MPEPMTDERLREIEAMVTANEGRTTAEYIELDGVLLETLAEVKRLRAENARLAEQNAAWKRLADSNGMAVGIRYD